MAIVVREEAGVRIVEGPPGLSLMRRPQDATLVLEACFPALSGRPVAPPTAGRMIAVPQVGGLHHRYERAA
jgi:hypothetical protein